MALSQAHLPRGCSMLVGEGLQGTRQHMGRERGVVGTSPPASTLPWCLFQKRVLFLTNDYFFTDINDTPFR